MKMIFIPGLGVDERLFSHQINHFSDQFTCEVKLLRQATSLEIFAEKIASELEEKAIIVGHSLGGGTGQIVAALYPEKVERLIIINGWCQTNRVLNEYRHQVINSLMQDETYPFADFEKMQSMVAKCWSDKKQLIDLLVDMRLYLGRSVYLNQLIALTKSHQLVEYAKKIICQTLILHGEEDKVFPLCEQAFLHANIIHSHLTRIENCGHIAPLEQAEQVTNAIAKHVQAIQAESVC